MLPKIDLPIYEVLLPSTGEKIQYRPFTVKEEKILLVAQESKDPSQEVLASKQVVNNCLVNKDVSELAMFDLEYILLLLRSRSVDNNVKFSIKDPDTGESHTLEVDLESIQFIRSEGHTNKVPINDDYTLFLKYPTIDQFVQISQMDQDDPLVSYFILLSCLDKVASEDEVFEFKNYSEKEVDQFMEEVSGEVLKGIQNFFETMPKLRHEMPYTNSEGKEQTFVIEGTRTFFI